MPIYFAEPDEHGAPSRIKIGYSQHPEHRIKELQVGSPYRLRTRAVIPGSKADEREWHRHFAPYHLHGEWFLAHPSLLDAIILGRLGGKGHENTKRPPSKTRTPDFSWSDLLGFWEELKPTQGLDFHKVPWPSGRYFGGSEPGWLYGPKTGTGTSAAVVWWPKPQVELRASRLAAGEVLGFSGAAPELGRVCQEVLSTFWHCRTSLGIEEEAALWIQVYCRCRQKTGCPLMSLESWFLISRAEKICSEILDLHWSHNTKNYIPEDIEPLGTFQGHQPLLQAVATTILRISQKWVPVELIFS